MADATASMDAYHVHFRVDLHPYHPRYYEFEDGVLCICVWAHDAGHARLKAGMMVDALPYQVLAEPVIGTKPVPQLPICADLENCARSFGVGIGFIGREIGESWDDPTWR